MDRIKTEIIVLVHCLLAKPLKKQLHKLYTNTNRKERERTKNITSPKTVILSNIISPSKANLAIQKPAN